MFLEYLFKCLFVVGVGDCYELGRVFCNGEVGGCYNFEFIMFEWYCVGWDYYCLIGEMVVLVCVVLLLV